MYFTKNIEKHAPQKKRTKLQYQLNLTINVCKKSTAINGDNRR